MPEAQSALTRRDVLAAAAAAGVATMMPTPLSAQSDAIQPFKVHFP
ncbi:MAG: Epoxide hydrolase domain protein, partial [Xanthobacteraceae bacterium]|nr:Epoxide hydrolase domain protein [Xanthobacteraceae bacterium]